MNRFTEGDVVQVLIDHSGYMIGHFGVICSSGEDFCAVSFNGDIRIFHYTALKSERETVFTEDDLGDCT